MSHEERFLREADAACTGFLIADGMTPAEVARLSTAEKVDACNERIQEAIAREGHARALLAMLDQTELTEPSASPGPQSRGAVATTRQ